MSTPIGQSPRGKLNKDADFQSMRRGDYPHAKNISPVTNLGESAWDEEITLGNLYRANLGTVVVQDKKIKIYVNTANASSIWEFVFRDQNQAEIFTLTLDVASFPNINDFLVELNALWNAGVPAGWTGIFDYGVIVGGVGGSGYVELTLGQTAYVGSEWYVVTTDTFTGDPADQAVLLEAIDLSITGYYRCIGSYDLLGELFIWATPCRNFPRDIDILTTIDSAGTILVRTTDPHGLTAANNGEVVAVSGSVSPADGQWFMTYVNANDILLVGSVWNTVAGAGTLTVNVNRYGTIASVTYNINTDVWTLKKLIRTKKFPWLTKKQIEGEVHKIIVGNAIQTNFYWTDDYDIPRCMYYRGTYIDDGAIDVLNPQTNPGDDGLYAYDTLSDETQQLLNNNRGEIAYLSMVQNGGGVKAGNNLYLFCLETENGSTTAYSYPTNPVNVYSAEESTSNNEFILGDVAGTATPKRVLLEITGLDVGLFKYVNLININVIGPQSFVVRQISRTLITNETMQLEHSGLEQNSFTIDPSLLLVQSVNLKTARHLLTLDNILLYGDITLWDDYDLTPVTTQVWHRLRRYVMPMCGFAPVLGPACEYQVVDHVHRRAGYRYNETHRFAYVFTRRGTGIKTKGYFADDVRFDDSATNRVTSGNSPYGNRRGVRIKAITYNINLPAPGDTTVSFQLDLGFDHGYIVGDQFEVIGATGLAPGGSINAVQTITAILGPIVYLQVEILGTIITGTYNQYSGHINGALPDASLTNDPSTSPEINGEVYAFYPEFSNLDGNYVLPDGKRLRDVFESYEIVRRDCIDEVLLTGILLPSDDYGSGTWEPQSQFFGSPTVANVTNYTTALGDPDRRLGFFVSPDILYDFRRVAYSPGDKIIDFGPGQPRYIALTNLPAGANKDKYIEFNGAFAYPDNTYTINLENSVNVSRGGAGTIIATTIGSVPYSLTGISYAPGAVWDMNMVLAAGPAGTDYFETGALNSSVDNVQYFHELTDKFGAITEGVYIPTGHKRTLGFDEETIFNNDNVFGGDVFTQKTYLHLIYKFSAAEYGFIGMSFYSQNKVNTQMRNYDPNDTGQLFPPYVAGVSEWIAELASGSRDQFRYNKGYSMYNLVGAYYIPAYDPSIIYVNDLPATIVYTPIKNQGSLEDTWRMILPLARLDLDLSKGNLMGMFALNGELYTLQQLALIRQFLTARGILQTDGGQEVILGSSGPLSQNGKPLSSMGCDGKWYAHKGFSEGGGDTLYYINLQHGKFMRFGADGTVPLSDIQGMESWFANYLDWVRNKDNPADDEGICMVWHGRKSELKITFRGRKTTDEWELDENYEIGDEVHLATQPAGTYANFSQTGEIYVATSNALATPNNMPDTGEFWEDAWRKVLHTEREYFSEFTLIYNEKKNSFTCYESPLPNIYLQVGRGYMTPFPGIITGEGETFASNRLYEHNKGEYAEWNRAGVYSSTPFGGMAHTIGSLTLAGSGFLTMFPYPQAYTYSIEIDGIKFFVESVESDISLTLQTIKTTVDNGETWTTVFPITTGTVTDYYVSLAEDAEIDMIVNEEPNISKIWEYLQINTEVFPDRVDFQTPTHISYLKQEDFEYLENYFYSQVKSDTTSSPSDNTADTSELFGPWIKVGLKMRRFVYQKVRNLIITCENNLPNPLK